MKESAILMHKPRNRQRHLWLLAGTGEGPVIAKALLTQGFQVSVSVVTESAALAYAGVPLTHLRVGALACSADVIDRIRRDRIDGLVDATHPFATTITAQLREASAVLGCPLLRYERPVEPTLGSRVVTDPSEIPAADLAEQNVLLALGARHLPWLVPALAAAGAVVHARVLPTPLALRQAVAAGIPERRIALLRPLQGGRPGLLEMALCRRWAIDLVICRQSGGGAERSWHQVCTRLDRPLWLLRRPLPPPDLPLVQSVEDLLVQVGRW